MDLIDELRGALGAAHVLTGPDMARHATDWTGAYVSTPLAVARPETTAEAAATLRIAARHGVAVVPVAGNTGVCGGTHAEGALMVSVERLNRVREIRPKSRIAVVEAGVILDHLHAAAAEHGLSFPMTFGARGSAMLGGMLATNAGGSNVVRHGNTRALCLGLEVVLASGEVLDVMTALHKDNSGYDLRDLFIGAEGTLGLITAAVVKLVPAPRAVATAMVAVRDLPAALDLLNRLQEATEGAVEAFEYMPQSYLDALAALHPAMRPPFDARHETTLLVEIATIAARDADPRSDGAVPLTAYLEEVLTGLMEEGAVVDAVIAGNEAQRREMWARREVAAEVSMARKPAVVCDIAVPLDCMAPFLAQMEAHLAGIDPEARPVIVAHVGDGNIHYAVSPRDPALLTTIMEAVEETALRYGGSFSAEHGVGRSKLPSMARRKDPVALSVMRAIKAALDPEGRMNPGKVLPD